MASLKLPIVGLVLALTACAESADTNAPRVLTGTAPAGAQSMLAIDAEGRSYSTRLAGDGFRLELPTASGVELYVVDGAGEPHLMQFKPSVLAAPTRSVIPPFSGTVALAQLSSCDCNTDGEEDEVTPEENPLDQIDTDEDGASDLEDSDDDGDGAGDDADSDSEHDDDGEHEGDDDGDSDGEHDDDACPCDDEDGEHDVDCAAGDEDGEHEGDGDADGEHADDDTTDGEEEHADGEGEGDTTDGEEEHADGEGEDSPVEGEGEHADEECPEDGATEEPAGDEPACDEGFALNEAGECVAQHEEAADACDEGFVRNEAGECVQ